MKITLGPRSTITQREFEASLSMPFIVKALSDHPLVRNKMDVMNASAGSDSPEFDELAELSNRVLDDLATKLDIRNALAALFGISAVLMAKHSPQQLQNDGDPFTPFFIAQLMNFCGQSASSMGIGGNKEEQSLDMH